MKTIKNYLKTIPLAFVLLTACSKDESPTIKEPSIYIAGNTYYSDTDQFVATLWKDENSSFLTDKTTYSEVTDLFVTNTDVYVGGYISKNENSIATIWKNGNPTYLTDGTQSTSIEAIHVSGSDVYAVGMEYNTTLNKHICKLWKNGEETTIGDNFTAKDLFIHNSNIYIVGYNRAKSLLWKNGTLTELTDGSIPSSPASVYVTNTDVYVVGYENRRATLWKNGTPTYLSDQTTFNASARAIYTDGSDVYIVGNVKNNSDSNYKAILWKNGVETELENGIESSFALDITVVNNNTYVAGYTEKNQTPQATIWENGKQKILGDENSYTVAHKIVVK